MNSKGADRKEIFENKSVPAAVFALVIPTIITQILNIIYNFADTWFVGRTGDENAVAAISVAMPLFIIMAALSNLFGIGASSVISRSLGAKREEDAKSAFAFALWGSVAAAVVYGILIFLFKEKMVYIIGGDDNSKQYIVDYLFWTVTVGSIPTMLTTLFGHLVRSVGKAKAAGLIMSSGAVMNIVLDPLFMFVLLPKGNEVTGAAVATLVSNVISCVIFIVYVYKSKDSVFTLNMKDFNIKSKIVPELLATGAPACLSTTLAMVSNIAANLFMSSYGTAAVAGLGIAKKANTLAFNINMGLTQGVLPLIGYTYAAKNYDRMKKTIMFTLAVAVSFSVTCTLIYRNFASPIIRFFIDEPDTVYEGTKLLPTLSIAVVFCAMTFLMNTIFQATGKKLYSLVTSVLRKGLFDIPLMYLFGKMWQETGVVVATPVSEVLSIIVAGILLFRFLKSVKNINETA